MSKNIYFSLQTLRRGLRERGGARHTDTQRHKQSTGFLKVAECAFAKSLTLWSHSARPQTETPEGRR